MFPPRVLGGATPETVNVNGPLRAADVGAVMEIDAADTVAGAASATSTMLRTRQPSRRAAHLGCHLLLFDPGQVLVTCAPSGLVSPPSDRSSQRCRLPARSCPCLERIAELPVQRVENVPGVCVIVIVVCSVSVFCPDCRSDRRFAWLSSDLSRG